MSGTLEENEHHPAADHALDWIRRNYNIDDMLVAQEAFASCSIENNRLAEICLETLNRVMSGEPVSDRYLLGLAWELRNIKETR